MVGGTVLFKKFAPENELGVGTAVQSLAAGSGLLPIAFAFEPLADILPCWRLIVTLGYLVLLVSALAYVLWFHLLTVFGATAASSYHFLMHRWVFCSVGFCSASLLRSAIFSASSRRHLPLRAFDAIAKSSAAGQTPLCNRRKAMNTRQRALSAAARPRRSLQRNLEQH
jgi:hypothetical protein